MVDTKLSAETASTGLDGDELVRISEPQGTSPETWQTKGTTALVLGHQYIGAEVYLSADQDAIDLSSNPDFNYWDTEDSNNQSGWWDGSASPDISDRITPSSGMGYKRFQVGVQFYALGYTGASNLRITLSRYNSSNTLQETLRADTRTGLGDIGHMALTEFNFSDGDYFNSKLYCSDTSIDVQSATRLSKFWVRLIAADPV